MNRIKQKPEEESKRKPKYGVLSCVLFSLQKLWQTSPSCAVSTVAAIPVSLVISAIGLYLPSTILGALEIGEPFLQIISLIAALMATQLVFSLVHQYVDHKRQHIEFRMVDRMYFDLYQKILSMDHFLKLEDDNETIRTRAHEATRNNHAAGVHFLPDACDILTYILHFLLFGTVISVVSPWVTFFLIFGALVNFRMAMRERDRNRKRQDIRNKINKKFRYLVNVAVDLRSGKDIRLFGFADFLDHLTAVLYQKHCAERKKTEANALLTAFVSFLIILLRDGFAYVFLIHQVVTGKITVAEFVVYFSAITQLSEFISGILNTWSKMLDGALAVSDFREFFDIKNKMNHGKGIPLPTSDTVSIEFKNVSYKYPKNETKILDNVSFTIQPGEKIALVGVNGAGKTTMTMLMCGLLIPDKGEVLIDGHSIYEYNRDELYSLFSLVPQKYSLLPISIAENIAVVDTEAGEFIDYERLNYCIEAAGLDERIELLPMGIQTPLNRKIHKDAVDLSGGEEQKLLLARAMYRRAKILILDEPTAALDPIAEDRLYRRYSDIAAQTTSVFISHRLASTQFCDRIFFLDNGHIAEEGTHDTLMANGGKYRELFDIQAKYYKEERKNGA